MLLPCMLESKFVVKITATGFALSVMQKKKLTYTSVDLSQLVFQTVLGIVKEGVS